MWIRTKKKKTELSQNYSWRAEYIFDEISSYFSTVNFVPPVIVGAVNITKNSCNITWEEYDPVNWNAPNLFSYELFYEEVIVRIYSTMSKWKSLDFFNFLVIYGEYWLTFRFIYL